MYDWQPTLIFVRSTSNFLCMCTYCTAHVQEVWGKSDTDKGELLSVIHKICTSGILKWFDSSLASFLKSVAHREQRLTKLLTCTLLKKKEDDIHIFGLVFSSPLVSNFATTHDMNFKLTLFFCICLFALTLAVPMPWISGPGNFTQA